MRQLLFVLVCFVLVANVKLEIVLKNSLGFDNVNGAVDDKFGNAVDVSANYIVIGVPGHANGSGIIHIHSKNGSLWNNTVTMVTPDGSIGGNFGSSVALHDHILIVGRHTHGSNGIAYIFENNGTWWHLSAVLEPNESADRFGTSVAVTETYAVVGCLNLAVFVYKKVGTNWFFDEKLTQSDGEATDEFGSSVTVHGSRLVVGAPSHTANGKRQAGAAYVYERNALVWNEAQKLTPNPAVLYEKFGNSVHMDETRVVIGGFYYDSDKGRVHVFSKDDNNTWVIEALLYASDQIDSNAFGCSVSISGDLLVIGANQATVTPPTGKAYIFQHVNNTWSEVDILTNATDAKFGTSVAIDNYVVVVGAPSSNSNGSVFMYDFTTVTPYEVPFIVECHESYVKALYRKATFPADEYNLSLNDQTCESFDGNDTFVWISTDFNKCGTIITEDESRIFIENSVHVKHMIFRTQVTVTETLHRYNIKCEYSRYYNVSLSGGYFVDVRNTRLVNISSFGTFRFNMDIYDSIEFLKKSDSPITVTSGEPIYVDVNVADSNATIKFAVNQCFATPTVSTNDASDIFFHNKCPIDTSFEEILSSTSRFRFVVNAFRFIQVTGAVYLHCRINVCTGTSNSTLCEQICLSPNVRKRREIDPGFDSKEVLLTSKRVVYKQKTSCHVITCPLNSKCVKTFPAQCRCNPGFVFTPKYNACLSDQILDVNEGLRIELEWHKNYQDPDSIEFLTLAIKIEQALHTFFVKNIRDIEGVKVNNLKQGSVIVDYSLRHSTTSNAKIVFESLAKVVKVQNKTIITDTLTKLEIKIHRIPDYVGSNGSMKINGCSAAVITVIVLVSLQITDCLSW